MPVWVNWLVGDVISNNSSIGKAVEKSRLIGTQTTSDFRTVCIHDGTNLKTSPRQDKTHDTTTAGTIHNRTPSSTIPTRLAILRSPTDKSSLIGS
jgi:hypothetical protein